MRTPAEPFSLLPHQLLSGVSGYVSQRNTLLSAGKHHMLGSSSSLQYMGLHYGNIILEEECVPYFSRKEEEIKALVR